jgi:hypothetical protein
VPPFPRLRALALFGRRPPQLVDSLVMPASENLHNASENLHNKRHQSITSSARASNDSEIASPMSLAAL